MTELNHDRVQTAAATIQKVMDNPDKEKAELIKAAREDYESMCLFFILKYIHLLSALSLHLSTFYEYEPQTQYLKIYFPELALNEKLHDLAALLNFDTSRVPGETLGEESIHCHQKLLQEQWGSDNTAVLPEDDVQQLLLGVHSGSRPSFIKAIFFLIIFVKRVLMF